MRVKRKSGVPFSIALPKPTQQPPRPQSGSRSPSEKSISDTNNAPKRSSAGRADTIYHRDGSFVLPFFVVFLLGMQISPVPPKPLPPAQAYPGQVASRQIDDSQSAVREGPEPINSSEINQMPVPTPLEFQSRGLDYEALTREGITVMFSPLPPHIKEFNVIQITVTDGSPVSWTVKPDDFVFVRADGSVLQSVSADYVVESLLEKASRNDVIKLQMLYENTIYALSNFRATNGYEQRREAAQAQFVNRGFKAAAAASAITFVTTKLKPGDSTDGAIFFSNKSKDKGLGSGRLVVRTCGQIFLFQVYGESRIRP